MISTCEFGGTTNIQSIANTYCNQPGNTEVCRTVNLFLSNLTLAINSINDLVCIFFSASPVHLETHGHSVPHIKGISVEQSTVCWIFILGAKHHAPMPGENFKHSCPLYLDIGVTKENTATQSSTRWNSACLHRKRERSASLVCPDPLWPSPPLTQVDKGNGILLILLLSTTISNGEEWSQPHPCGVWNTESWGVLGGHCHMLKQSKKHPSSLR